MQLLHLQLLTPWIFRLMKDVKEIAPSSIQLLKYLDWSNGSLWTPTHPTISYWNTLRTWTRWLIGRSSRVWNQRTCSFGSRTGEQSARGWRWLSSTTKASIMVKETNSFSLYIFSQWKIEIYLSVIPDHNHHYSQCLFWIIWKMKECKLMYIRINAYIDSVLFVSYLNTFFESTALNFLFWCIHSVFQCNISSVIHN